jgi:DNA-binding CsgD family transcriptional regulator
MTGSQLVERDRETAALAALIDAMPSGEGRVAWIEGPAGIGKSTLLAEARRYGVSAGAEVLAARGSELEREFPFGMVRQLFEAVVSDPRRRERLLAGAAAPAAAVFGAPDSAANEGDVSFAALHGLFWVALNLAADRPLILAIDDLHWCDRPSMRFVAYLARRLEGQPILVATTIRTGEPGTDVALMGEIANDPSTIAVRPVPLSAEAVRSLVRERLGADADDVFCSACHEATGGNPLFLRQLLTALETDRVKPQAANADVVLEIGPRAVSRTVIMRLSRLSQDAIAVARAVAVLTESATLPAVAALTELDETRVADATGALARAEILRPEAPLGFVHALVRDAVYQELPLGERELRHERAARVLLDAGAPPEQVAAHLLGSPRRGQDWVAEQLREAGRAAVKRGAPESGVAILRRALEEPAPAAWRPELLMELGLAEVLTEGPTAIEHLKEAYETLEVDVFRALVANALVHALVFTDHTEEAAAFARRAGAEMPDALADERRGLFAFEMIMRFFGVGAPEDLDALADHLEPPAPGATLGVRRIAAMAALWRSYTGGDADTQAALALAALEGDELATRDNGLLALAALNTLVLGDRPEADEQWAVAQREAHRHGSLLGVSSLHLWHGFALLQLGELTDAEESLRAAQAEFDTWGFGITALRYTSAFLATILAERGRLDEARAMLERARPHLDAWADGSRFWRAANLALLVAEGRDEEALAAYEEFTRQHAWITLPAATHPRSSAARALDRLGRSDEAIALAESELADARRWGAPGTVGPVLRVLGNLRGDVSLLEQAVEVLEDSRSRLELAKALADLGAAMRRDRRPSDARDPLRRALELADACGAGGLVEHVRSELYATGARPRTTATGGVDALTASERRVAGFAAEGQSNRDIAQTLFVTPKTVEVHLSNAYRKLGIRSRRELAGALGGAAT